MKLLTKEQAEGLKLHMQTYKCSHFTRKEEGILYTLRPEYVFGLFDLIDECTENEFPHIRLEADLGSVEVLQTSGNEISLGMSWSNVSSTIDLLPLNFEQFKEFTAGCNKIVEWIKEQE